MYGDFVVLAILQHTTDVQMFMVKRLSGYNVLWSFFFSELNRIQTHNS